MKFTSQIIASGSGSIGGCTYSRNRSGPYIRNRSVPVNTNTSFQLNARNAFTQMVTRWTEVLDTDEKASWDLYALNTPVIDSLGRSIVLTGQNMYIRSNSFRQQRGMPIEDDAPTIFDLGTFTPPHAIPDNSTQAFSISFTGTDDWANEDDAALVCFQGHPMNATRNFYNGPYRFIGRVNGSATLPPVSPSLFNAQIPIFTAQKVGMFYRVTRGDARLSTPAREITVVVA